LSVEWALLVTSHACLLAALIVLYRYCRSRLQDVDAAQFAMVSAALMPTTFFFRMAYSEALIFLVGVLALYAMAREWKPHWIALVVGVASAARPSGVALLLPFAVHLWLRGDRSTSARLRRMGWLVLGAWGILAFMIYCGVKFGNPVAFAHAQAQWRVRPNVGLGEKIRALFTFAAIRGVYDKSSPFWWGRFFRMGPAVFNLYFANSLYLIGTVAIVVTGWLKRWLNPVEVALAVGLVGVPYLVHNYETSMMAEGRYMAPVVTTYLVLGLLLRRLPVGIAVGIAALSAFMLGVYSAMFGAWYWLV
jgi:hypothetical protein